MDIKTKIESQNSREIIGGQQDFESAILDSLDIGSWAKRHDLAALYERHQAEVQEAINNEDRVVEIIRNEIFPRFGQEKGNLPFTGLQGPIPMETIKKVHFGLLFNGAVEAVDGTTVTHDTLPLTITQIGVCLVSYQGELGAYSHRIYRKDLKIVGDDPIKEVMQLLEERRDRGAQGIEENSSQLSSLALRGLMAYAERAILMSESKALWRMGHGNPFPYELLTGYWAGRKEMTITALKVMRQMVEHEKFVFIPSAPRRRELLALGNALNPGEFILIDTVTNGLKDIIDKGNARGEKRQMQEEFIASCGEQVVYGLFKASKYSPAYMFYAHKDHASKAAAIAMADSILQKHRGFPMLIDIADNICTSTFNPETFFSSIRQAYAEVGQPFRYLGERETRGK
jgi:hypothetical protein